MMTNGTMTLGIGASYIGEGGYCKDEVDRSLFKKYGAFDMTPVYSEAEERIDDRYGDMLGSIGHADDVETAGGGRVVVIADSVTLEGEGEKIQANARPYDDFSKRSYSLTGGSGGYIYVKTTNTYKENTIDKESKISARGGYAIGDHAAGSGGVIVFDDNFHIPFRQVSAAGGVAEDQGKDGCNNGAAGTVFMVKNNTLVVDNNRTQTTSLTFVQVPNVTEDGAVPMVADKLYV